MKRSFAAPYLIVLLALAAPAASRAQSADREPQPPAHRAMMGDMHGHEAMMEGLQLSEDQKSRLKDVHYRHMKKSIGMRADLELATLELRRLMSAESPDERAIDAQIDRIAAMRAGLRKAGVASMFEARSILTPDQRRQWHGGMMHGGMMRGGMMRGGMKNGGMMHGGPRMHDGTNRTQHGQEGEEN